MMEESVFDRFLHDCQNSAAGISRRDPHLLSDGAFNLRTHSSMLRSLITENVNPEISEDLMALQENLQQLRALVDENLRLCNEEEKMNAQCHLDLDSAFVFELRKQGMPWSKIANAHGISRNSLYKFRKKCNIEEPNQTISDADLRNFISHVSVEYPNAGTILMQSALLTRGYRVSKERVWRCLREIDPVGVATRRRKSIRRRVYKVKAANSLWHIDSSHKLIMYGFIFHGCIDGYSRRVKYVHVSDKNTSEVVMKMFGVAVARCGLPRRVRADKGSENSLVRDFIREQHQRVNAFLYGKSLHNVRIERLWRDVNGQVSSFFKEIFLNMEEQECLDITANLDMFCLSYVFMPRIKERLKNFVSWWNNRRVRTMLQRSPNQVWSISMMEQGLLSACDSHLVTTVDDELESDAYEACCNFFDNEQDRQQVMLECQRVVPDPLSEDYCVGRNHYLLLRNHLLRTMETNQR